MISRHVSYISSHIPRWIMLVLSLMCLALGVFLTFRPFTSVETLVRIVGIVAIITGLQMLGTANTRSMTLHRIVGIGWIVFGFTILAWPNTSIDALALVVGLALAVDGLLNIILALVGRRGEPISELIGGVASTIFGALAISWPDVTVFVVAVLFGARTVLFGLTQLLALGRHWLRPHVSANKHSEPKHHRLQMAMRVGTRVGALVIALVLLSVSVVFQQRVSAIPAFYDTPDSGLDTHGVLLRSELLDRKLPPNTTGWLMLYSTTTSLGEPAAGSAFVLASTEAPPGSRPVILWTHGTVGITRPCAPSLTDDVTYGIPAVTELLKQGWILVAPDYVGLGTEGPMPYLIGPGQAYSALDSLQAAYQLTDLSFSPQTVVWGHSQGGHAALWVGLMADEYAPDLEIDGIAAIAPATDLESLAESIQGAMGGSILSAYVITAYSNTYSDVHFDDYVRRGARTHVREAASRCLANPALALSVISGIGVEGILSSDLTSGGLSVRIEENTPTVDFDIPVLIAAGDADGIISFPITETWVADQCAAGFDLEFRTYPGFGHLNILEPTSPMPGELIDWTKDRFAGRNSATTC